MAVESATYISDLDPATIGDSTDPAEGGRQVSLVKLVLKNTFPNVSGQVSLTQAQLNSLPAALTQLAGIGFLSDITADAAELNVLDGITASTAELNLLDGVTVSTAELNKTALLGDITALDEDLSSVSATHDTLPTAKAVKDFVDAEIGALDFASEGYVDLRAKVVVTGTLPIESGANTATILVPIGVTGTLTRVDLTAIGAGVGFTLKTSSNATIASGSVSDGSVTSETTLTNTSLTVGSFLRLDLTESNDGNIVFSYSLTVEL